MQKPLLTLNAFSKTYRSHWTFRAIGAVRDISLDVFPGESFGFLGHNGAGKTTTIKCILGLLRLSGGEILFDGKNLQEYDYRKALGYLPEQPYFYDHLTVEETLRFFCSLQEISGKDQKKRVDEVLELVRLGDRKKSSVRALSKGLQQRLGLAQAILNQPRLLLLDEPFSGLDPLGRLEVRKILLGLRAQGTTLFLSSHILSDVENLCDRVAIMAKGKLKSVFSLSETASLFGEEFELVLNAPPGEEGQVSELCKLAQSSRTEPTNSGEHSVLRFSQYAPAAKALAQASSSSLTVEAFKRVGLSLEDIFVRITEEKTIPEGECS